MQVRYITVVSSCLDTFTNILSQKEKYQQTYNAKNLFPVCFLISAIQRDLPRIECNDMNACWWYEIRLLLISSQHHTPASEKRHWFLLSFSLILEEVVGDKHSIACSKNHVAVIQSTVFCFTL
jgi:hypothetical protein